MVLTTYGGDPDAAYRMARAIKCHYEHFSLYVFGYCKSAGTLLALGADEIIMGSFGEFGPLDVQLFKSDEITVRGSGLDVYTCLAELSSQAFNFFEDHLMEIKKRSGGLISTKTAGELATSIAVGLLSPITSQVDPIRLGEVRRALNVAIEYGKRLGADEKALHQLTSSYPSHSFIIDFDEVKDLLNARRPDKLELQFEEEIRNTLQASFGGDAVRIPNHPNVLVGKLNEAATPDADKGKDEDDLSKSGRKRKKTAEVPAEPVQPNNSGNGGNAPSPQRKGQGDNSVRITQKP